MPFDAFNHVVHEALLDVGIDARPRQSFRGGGPPLGASKKLRTSMPHLSPDSASMSRQGALRRRHSLVALDQHRVISASAVNGHAAVASTAFAPIDPATATAAETDTDSMPPIEPPLDGASASFGVPRVGLFKQRARSGHGRIRRFTSGDMPYQR